MHLDRESIGPDIVMTKPGCAHHWTGHDHSSDAEIIPRLAKPCCHRQQIGLDAATIAQLPRLQMIAVSATGYDKIDIAACRAHGIVVSNIRGYAADTVPEHTFALILALRRSLKGFQADMEAGAWQASTQFCLFTQPVNDLKGTTLGLIGSGAIGSAVGRIAEPWDEVIKAARKSVGNNSIPAGYTAFEEVIDKPM